MSDIHLIQITEVLPPRLNGIGDYAYKLASRFKELNCINTSFMLLDDGHDSIEVEKHFPVHYVSPSQEDIISTLSRVLETNSGSKNVILLHYDRGVFDRYINVNEYEKNFFPLKLIGFLDSMKGQFKQLELIIIFHEFLWPRIERRRDYFLRPLQNHYLKKVIKYSNSIVCNNPTSAKQINRLCQNSTIQISPVFSNIGELTHNPIEAKKEGSWVIFGTTDPLKRTVSRFLEDLNAIIGAFTIDTISIIGGKLNSEILCLIDKIKLIVPTVSYMPEVSCDQISDVFKKSKFCYMNYFSQDLGADSALVFKSGVFAAACSHGVIPVFGNLGMENIVGQLEYPGCIVKRNGLFSILSTDKLDNLSTSIFNWYYKKASLDSTVKTISKLL